MIDCTKLSRDYNMNPIIKVKIPHKSNMEWEKIPYNDLYKLYIEENYSIPELVNNHIVPNLSYLTRLLKEYNIKKDTKCMKLKREQTNLKRYGVSYYQHLNKGITNYTGNMGTEEFIKKSKRTKLLKYGDENYNNSKQRQITNLQKYDCLYPAQCNIDKDILLILENKDKLKNYIMENHIVNACDLANKLNISNTTALRSAIKHNLTNLFDYSQSVMENNIKDYIKQYINIENNVKLLDGKEIDIYIPEKKIGIAFNGNYWHSEIKVNKQYHYEKSKLAEEKGIFLYHIFEHEWITKQDKIINQLNNLLGLNDTKIYARKCEIREVSNQEKRQFLEENHLQGNDNSSVKLGLYYQDELVSLMTFCKPRFNKKYEWELSRFCCKANCSVIGGASKLFKYFVSIYKPKSVISYSDIAKTKGNLYNVLGFTFDHIAEPNFVWIKGNEVLSRYQCQKHKLLALGYTGSTGIEIMHERGYNRLYDAGNKVWVWKT